jgi:hypothetical protein
MIEAMGLKIKIIASRSPWMTLHLYQISLKSTKRFKVISGGHTDWWFDKPASISEK